MIVKQLLLGPMANYSYVVGLDETRLCFFVDPAWDAVRLEREAESAGLKPAFIILTHGHADHANAAGELSKKLGLPVWIQEKDARMLGAGIKPDILTGDGQVPAGDAGISIIHTPGHTPGSCCALAEGNLFTGDTLFIGDIGRVDLPGSDPEAMRLSLRRLAMLPPDTKIFPGHAYPDASSSTSTIGEELKTNPYLQLALKDKEAFIKAAL